MPRFTILDATGSYLALKRAEDPTDAVRLYIDRRPGAQRTILNGEPQEYIVVDPSIPSAVRVEVKAEVVFNVTGLSVVPQDTTPCDVRVAHNPSDTVTTRSLPGGFNVGDRVNVRGCENDGNPGTVRGPGTHPGEILVEWDRPHTTARSLPSYLASELVSVPGLRIGDRVNLNRERDDNDPGTIVDRGETPGSWRVLWDSVRRHGGTPSLDWSSDQLKRVDA